MLKLSFFIYFLFMFLLIFMIHTNNIFLYILFLDKTPMMFCKCVINTTFIKLNYDDFVF